MGTKLTILLGFSGFLGWYALWGVLDYLGGMKGFLDWFLRLPTYFPQTFCFPYITASGITCSPMPSWVVVLIVLPLTTFWFVASVYFLIKSVTNTLGYERFKNAEAEDQRIERIINRILDERELRELRRKRDSGASS